MNSRSLFFAVLLCFIASSALAQDAAPAKQDPAVVRKYLAMRAKIVAELKEEWLPRFERLNEDDQFLIRMMFTRARTSALTNQFKIARINKQKIVEILPGAFGTLLPVSEDENNVYIYQVIDGTTALAAFSPTDLHKGSKKLFCLKGVATDDWKDKSHYFVRGFYHVSGVYNYKSEKGVAKSAPEVTPFDPSVAMESFTPEVPSPNQDPAVVQKYLTMRAELADQIEKQWRDKFEKTGRIPGEDENKDTPEAPTLDSPAKEHLGISNPKTLIPEMQKELRRLVKLSSSRELNRAAKRETKKQATKVRISLGYIKRHKEEFQKAFDGPKQKLEKLIADMKKSTLAEHFEIAEIDEYETPWLRLGRFGALFDDGRATPNIKIRNIINDSSVIASFVGNDKHKGGWIFEIAGISTKGFKGGETRFIPGFFYVSELSTYFSEEELKRQFVLPQLDAEL